MKNKSTDIKHISRISNDFT